MRFPTASSPHTTGAVTVAVVMRRVLYALVPGTLAYTWYFGTGVLLNIAIACVVALAAEAAVLMARGRAPAPYLSDGSALVTAVLLALALPPLLPWWVTTIGTAFAIVVGKQLYGGLGYNPFNPAMAGYVMLLISFPREMTQWLAPHMLAGHSLGALDTVRATFTGTLPPGLDIDSLTMATPLDTVKTQLGLNRTITEIRSSPLFGDFGGRGWEWIANWYLLGGLWMIYKRVISWHIPVAMLGTLLAMATLFFLIDPDAHASPPFHLFSGAAMLGAFFIATDPVSASTTPRGRLVYGAGIGLITYVIRTWGGYPDGVAFAVLLMNMAAPTIDYYTQPRVFGADRR